MYLQADSNINIIIFLTLKTIAELELTVGHLEDKQERDFERNKKMKEDNQVLNKLYTNP